MCVCLSLHLFICLSVYLHPACVQISHSFAFFGHLNLVYIYFIKKDTQLFWIMHEFQKIIVNATTRRPLCLLPLWSSVINRYNPSFLFLWQSLFVITCMSSRMMFSFHAVTCLFFNATGFYRPVSALAKICQRVLIRSSLDASCTDFEPTVEVKLFKTLLSLERSYLSWGDFLRPFIYQRQT